MTGCMHNKAWNILSKNATYKCGRLCEEGIEFVRLMFGSMSGARVEPSWYLWSHIPVCFILTHSLFSIESSICKMKWHCPTIANKIWAIKTARINWYALEELRLQCFLSGNVSGKRFPKMFVENVTKFASSFAPKTAYLISRG